jgi:hypothetical protein
MNLTMNVKKDAKMRLNATPQMGMKCCRFVIPAGFHQRDEAEMIRRHGTWGS